MISDPTKSSPEQLLHQRVNPVPAQRVTDEKSLTMDSKTSPPRDKFLPPAPPLNIPKTSVPITTREFSDSAMSGTNRPDKQEKRPEPQTVAEFIAAYYAGRAKVLSEATARRLKSSSISLEAPVRGELLRGALAADDSLDKTRRLLVLSTEVDELRALGNLLLQFAADVVLLHPAVRANGMQSHLFPPYGDESSLEDAWKLLKSSELKLPPNITVKDELPVAALVQESSSSTSNSSNNEIGISESTNRGAKVAVAIRAAQVTAAKARRNALLCSVVWRVLHRKQLPLAEAVRALRCTLFVQSVSESRLEAELLEALALMPEKEDAKIALLLQWTTKQQSDLVNKFTVGQSHIESLTERVADLEAKVEEGTRHAQSLQQQFESERASKEELSRSIGVVKTHGKADYEELRASSLRSVRDAVQQLEQVSVALGRDVPKVQFAREVLETIVDGLRTTTKKLEDL